MKRHLIEKNIPHRRLDRNECYHSTANKLLLDKIKLSSDDFSCYKTPFKIIKNLSNLFKVSINNIYIDSGSELVLRNLIFSLDEIKTWTVQNPTFEMFNYYCSLFNKNIKFFNEYPDYSDNIIKNKRYGLYLVSPHNPTGKEYSDKFIMTCCKNYKHVIIDMAYTNPIKFENLFLKCKNLTIVKTFSKMGVITGMRLGYSISNISIINKLNRLRPMFINSYAVKVGEFLTSSEGIKLLNKVERDFYDKRNSESNVICSAGNFVLTKKKSKYSKVYEFDGIKYYRKTLTL